MGNPSLRLSEVLSALDRGWISKSSGNFTIKVAELDGINAMRLNVCLVCSEKSSPEHESPEHILIEKWDCLITHFAYGSV